MADSVQRIKRWRFVCLFFLILLFDAASVLVFAKQAAAQRAEDNAVQAADDAFGVSVGIEQIGLYNSRNVRGFSPISAGNIRLEGYFVDRQADYSNRLISGSTIGAGLAAHDYLLPAPTGIANFFLRQVGETPVQSLFAGLEPYGGWRLSGDFQMRDASETWEAAFGAGYFRQVVNNGSRDLFASIGGNLQFVPSQSMNFRVYADYQWVKDQRSPQFFSDGTFTPPRILDRLDYVGQDWAKQDERRLSIGFLTTIDRNFATFHLGVGRSSFSTDSQLGQFVSNISQDGFGQLAAFFGPPSRAASNFMEARANKTFKTGMLNQQINLVARMRSRTRVFGGNVVTNFGAININQPVIFNEPIIETGTATSEKVEQVSLGAAYDAQVKTWGKLGLGIQTVDYRRRLQLPNGSDVLATASPFLFNASLAVNIGPWVTIFSSANRGFEEAPIAPDIAVNRNEAPEAIETEQIDAGIRFTLFDLSVLANVFRLEKPFFGIDGAQLFRALGTVQNRGVELSAAGPLFENLQMTFGAVFSDPKLSQNAQTQTALSADPIAFRRRRITLDLDYQPQWAPSWSFDASFLNLGKQNIDPFGNRANPGYSTLGLGLRRTFKVLENTLVLRGRLQNLFNTFAWDIRSSGGYFFNSPRSISLSLAMDI